LPLKSFLIREQIPSAGAIGTKQLASKSTIRRQTKPQRSDLGVRGDLVPRLDHRKGANITMKKVLVVPLTLVVSLIAGTAMAQEGFKVVDTITGTSLKFIQSALPELSRYGYSFKLDEYRIIIVTTGGITPLFSDT
jgi:hypothetical protein